jgi:hypothetical protein
MPNSFDGTWTLTLGPLRRGDEDVRHPQPFGASATATIRPVGPAGVTEVELSGSADATFGGASREATNDTPRMLDTECQLGPAHYRLEAVLPTGVLGSVMAGIYERTGTGDGDGAGSWLATRQAPPRDIDDFAGSYAATFGPLWREGAHVSDPRPFGMTPILLIRDGDVSMSDAHDLWSFTWSTSNGDPELLDLSWPYADNPKRLIYVEATVRLIAPDDRKVIGGRYWRLTSGGGTDQGDGSGSWVGTEVPPLPRL